MKLESVTIQVDNCLECPVSYRHPYDEELECSLSPTEPVGQGTRNTISCLEEGLPHNCPLRSAPVLLMRKPVLSVEEA